jgi:hypothetical protein
MNCENGCCSGVCCEAPDPHHADIPEDEDLDGGAEAGIAVGGAAAAGGGIFVYLRKKKQQGCCRRTTSKDRVELPEIGEGLLTSSS